MKRLIFVECGCCGAYHRMDFNGDCREDKERIQLEDIPRDSEIIDIEEKLRRMEEI